MAFKQSPLQKIRQKAQDHSGMTLIEVIVSFAILGVISAILLKGVSTGLSVMNEAQTNNESTNAYSSALDLYDETADTLTSMPGVTIDNTVAKTLTLSSTTDSTINGLMVSGKVLKASLDESKKDQYTYNADMQLMAFMATSFTFPTLPVPPIVEDKTAALWAPYVFTKTKDVSKYGNDTALGLNFTAFKASTGDIDGTVKRGVSDALISITSTTTTSASTATQLFLNAGIQTSKNRLYQSDFYGLSGTYTQSADDCLLLLAPKDTTATDIDNPDYLLIYIADGTIIKNSEGEQITFSKSFIVGDGQNDHQFSDKNSSAQALPSGYYWIPIPTSLSKNDKSGIIDYGNGTYGINLFDLCPEANGQGQKKTYSQTYLYQNCNTSVSNDSKDTGYYLDIGLLDTDATVTSLSENQKTDLESLRAVLQDRDVKMQTEEDTTTYAEPENLPEATTYTTKD